MPGNEWNDLATREPAVQLTSGFNRGHISKLTLDALRWNKWFDIEGCCLQLLDPCCLIGMIRSDRFADSKKYFSYPKRSVLVLKSPNVAFSLIHSISYLHSSMQWRHDWSFDDVTADLSTELPDFALVLRVHRRPDRTLEDVGKLLRVGENPDDPEAGRGVRVFKNLELVGLRGGSRAPDL